jgi:hypothetical protein
MSGISGWVGTGAGVIMIGACVIAFMFVHRLPAMSHPWIHRALIAGMYCGASAVTVTTIGQFILRAEHAVTGFFGGVASGVGYVAIVLAALFLLLTVAAAVIWLPAVSAGYLAVALVFTLALVPGGALRSVYAATAAPGQQAAAQLAAWLGG